MFMCGCSVHYRILPIETAQLYIRTLVWLRIPVSAFVLIFSAKYTNSIEESITLCKLFVHFFHSSGQVFCVCLVLYGFVTCGNAVAASGDAFSNKNMLAWYALDYTNIWVFFMGSLDASTHSHLALKNFKAEKTSTSTDKN